MVNKKTKRYVAWGSVCGECEHLHHTIKATQACIDHHSRGCVSQGGYNDQAVYVWEPDIVSYRYVNPVNQQVDEDDAVILEGEE